MTASPSLTASLAVALLSLVLWAVLTFALALPTGWIHLLLALGVTLLVRWYALAH